MTGTIAKKIIDAALNEQALSYDDRITALARAGQRLKALASDPVERLASRLVDMAGGDVRIATKDYEDIGTDMDIRAIELEAEAAVDARLRSEVAFNIHAGRPQDLSRINRKTVIPMIKEIVHQIVEDPDQADRKIAAAALAESIVMTGNGTLAGQDEVLLGAIGDMAKAGVENAGTYSDAVMTRMKGIMISFR